jgi:serine/threonine protein kinase
MAKIYYHEKNEEGNLIIESLILSTLDKLFKICSFNLDIKATCNIGYDILTCLEELYRFSFLHMDLKPDNIGFKLNDIKGKKK